MYVSDSVVCSSALLGNDLKGIDHIKWHDFFLIRLIKNRKFMEHLNEDLQPRMMPDFKFYKGLSFTRKKNDEYFTWSEIRYGSILKMNGTTHKNIQCLHIQLFGKKKTETGTFFNHQRGLAPPIGERDILYSRFPHFLYCCHTKFTLLPLHSFLYRLFETPGGIAFQVRHL